MENKFTAYIKKNALLLSLLLVALLILVALILNLTQGGFWIISGMNGKNAYELAVEEGFQGTRREWLESLKGEDGINGTDGADGLDGTNGVNGKSAYQIACDEGFEGSLEEWLLSLQFGEDGADGKDGADGQNGKNGKDGKDGENGSDGVSIVNVFINESGHLIVVLSNGERIDAGTMGNLIPSETPKTDYQLAVEGGFTGTLHQWLCSYVDGSRTDVSVSDILVDDQGVLTLTLDDGSVLSAGKIPESGNISESQDELGFYERFEIVILNHSSGALNLRAEPNLNAGTQAVANLPNGTELVCIGAGEVENSDGIFLYYRFLYNGKICYARAKHFQLKHDTSVESEPTAETT